MATNWQQTLQLQEQKLAVATTFLNNLVEGDVQAPDKAVELSRAALKDLTHHTALLSTIKRKVDNVADPSEIMNQPSVQKAWNEIVTATDQVLSAQDTLIEAYDKDLLNIVSREDMESMKGSPLSL